MKNLHIYLITIFLITTNSAFSQNPGFVKIDEEEIPSKIEIRFYNTFNKAQNVRWYKSKNREGVLYKGEFSNKGKSLGLVYDSKGEVLKSTVSIKKNDIPVEISDFFTSNYKGYRLVKLSRILINNESDQDNSFSYYELGVKIEDREVSFQFEEDHDLFKGKNYLNEVNYL